MLSASPSRIASKPPRDPRSDCLVVGYDGSDWSDAAVRCATQRVGSDGRVVVVHAYAPPPDLPSAANRQQIVEERRVNGRELLAKAAARCQEAAGDVTCETQLVEGAAPEALLAVARDRDAREILVGSRGSGGSWTPIGSVSRQLLNSADRPVIVVPSPSSDTR